MTTYAYNPNCGCDWCINGGTTPDPGAPASLGYSQPHIPPAGYRDQTAVIGHAPESRDHHGPGVPPQVHPTARIEAYATIDAGTDQPTHIGEHVYVMKHAHVGHDAWIGDHAELSTGCVIGGHATIEPGARIGINATILPYRRVGANARVGAGAVITHDVPAGETWAGNPARKLQDEDRDSRPHNQRGNHAPV